MMMMSLLLMMIMLIIMREHLDGQDDDSTLTSITGAIASTTDDHTRDKGPRHRVLRAHSLPLR